MQPVFFITGTDTGVGKTVFTALWTAFLRRQKTSVAAFKPLCSGGREDALALQSALGGTLTLDEINPWHFRAPLAPVLSARQQGARVTKAAILRHVRQTSRRNYRANLFEIRRFDMLFGFKSMGNIYAQRTPNACNFKTVCQSVVNKYATRKRKNLCFILKSTERCGENQPVVVALKFAAIVIPFCVICFLSEAFGR